MKMLHVPIRNHYKKVAVELILHVFVLQKLLKIQSSQPETLTMLRPCFIDWLPFEILICKAQSSVGLAKQVAMVTRSATSK